MEAARPRQFENTKENKYFRTIAVRYLYAKMNKTPLPGHENIADEHSKYITHTFVNVASSWASKLAPPRTSTDLASEMNKKQNVVVNEDSILMNQPRVTHTACSACNGPRGTLC